MNDSLINNEETREDIRKILHKLLSEEWLGDAMWKVTDMDSSKIRLGEITFTLQWDEGYGG